MSVSDAYVRVSCDRAECMEEIEIDLSFVYATQFGTGGHYDHSEEAIARKLKKKDWVFAGGRTFCCPDCEMLAT